MPLTPTEVNVIATAEAAKFAYQSLHTSDPGSTGTGEATGGIPAYARKSVVVTATAAVATGAQVTHDVPAGTYTHFGWWSALTSGTFYGGGALATSQVVSSQGQVKVTGTATITTT